MNVPLLDLKAQYATIKDEILAAMHPVMDAQAFILGPAVASFEKAAAAYCRAPFAVGVSSGTDALLLALMAENIGPGDEVITSPYSFFATAGSIARLGAKPVYVDIEPHKYNLDPVKIEAAITPRTRAIMPVHLYGRCAKMNTILEIARRHKLAVIEDAAQAIGADFQGERAGTMGDYGCFSFFPSKNLGGFGDGGLVTTNDPVRAERLRILRVHGMDPKYYHKFIGGNFRLDALQAAVLEVKLRHLDAWTAGRQRNALRYLKLFTDAGLVGKPVVLPKLPPATAAQVAGFGVQCSGAEAATLNPELRTLNPGNCSCRHVINQYVIRVPRRDELLKHLQKNGVGCEVYYPVPLHLQECFAYLGHKAGDFPESERAARETLALPVYPELTDAQAEYVVATVKNFFG